MINDHIYLLRVTSGKPRTYISGTNLWNQPYVNHSVSTATKAKIYYIKIISAQRLLLQIAWLNLVCFKYNVV